MSTSQSSSSSKTQPRRSSIQYLSNDNNNIRYVNHYSRNNNHQKLQSNRPQQQSCESINRPTTSKDALVQNAYVVDNDYSPTTITNSVSQRSTFYSMWNTFKYEFNHRFRNKFNFESPICLLGQLYHSKMSDSINWSDERTSNLYAYDKFKKDYFSRIWLTYRKDFPPLLNSNLTTDNGWGCMIRSGQMIFAQAFLSHFHGRNWRWEKQDDLIHRMIIKWFGDSAEKSITPFSIHEIVRVGQKFGKNPGDWFGPASISVIFKNLLDEASFYNPLLYDICCYIAQDCTVYLQDVIDLCDVGQNDDPRFKNIEWRSVIILIPVRLGGDQFNMFYAPYLKQVLSMPFCLGVIGGKPRHSLYFVGFQNDKLLAIDPHYCQKTINVQFANFSLESFHCTAPRRVSLQSIDPSCTIGFYLKNKEEFEEFITLSNQMLDHSFKIGGYPIFTLDKNKYSEQIIDNIGCLDGGRESATSSTLQPQQDQILQMQYRLVDSHGNVQKILSSEDFVLL